MTKQELIIEKQNEIIALLKSSQYVEVIEAINYKEIEVKELQSVLENNDKLSENGDLYKNKNIGTVYDQLSELHDYCCEKMEKITQKDLDTNPFLLGRYRAFSQIVRRIVNTKSIVACQDVNDLKKELVSFIDFLYDDCVDIDYTKLHHYVNQYVKKKSENIDE